ncbi:alpha/beta hydrolase [Paenibacillus apiarius]|nr:alpha/beta hydrolase [Paenibacillus apiarius]MCY9795844.1 alpha/beta hydrolase [Paenibacillus apiarius]
MKTMDRHIEISGTTEVNGDGDASHAKDKRPQLLWVHGWGMSSETWRHLAAELPGFDHRYVSYAACRTIEELREAVTMPLLLEPEEEWHAIGWSMGGMLLLEALDAWMAGPDSPAIPAMRSIVFCGTTLRFVDDTGQAGWPSRVVGRMRRRLAHAAEETLRAFAERLPSAAEREDAGLRRLLAQRVARMARSAAAPMAAAEQAAPSDSGAPAFAPEGLDAGLAYLQQADLAAAWARVTAAPAGPRLLWLHGADDTVCPLGALQRAQALNGQCNAARFTVLPQAGHVPFLTQPARWRKELKSWYDNDIGDTAPLPGRKCE